MCGRARQDPKSSQFQEKQKQRGHVAGTGPSSGSAHGRPGRRTGEAQGSPTRGRAPGFRSGMGELRGVERGEQHYLIFSLQTGGAAEREREWEGRRSWEPCRCRRALRVETVPR